MKQAFQNRQQTKTIVAARRTIVLSGEKMLDHARLIARAIEDKSREMAGIAKRPSGPGGSDDLDPTEEMPALNPND
jgi:hypothetical protein